MQDKKIEEIKNDLHDNRKDLIERMNKKMTGGNLNIRFLGEFRLKDKPNRGAVMFDLNRLPLSEDRKPRYLTIVKIIGKNNRIRVFAKYDDPKTENDNKPENN